MTELLRDASWLVLAWCAGLTLTYGVVESALMMPVRIWLASESSFLETLLYCPFCAGFWCQMTAWFLVTLDWRLALGGACIGTAVLLRARAVEVELVRSPFEAERAAIAAVREKVIDGRA